MDAFVAWLQGTALSQEIVYLTWLWPLCETLHFVGLALVIGIVGFFDLRLMGAFKEIPLPAVRSLMPLALLGFTINLVTGVIFVIGHPEQYVHNIAWWLKVASLVLAGLNALVFETTLARRTMQLPPGADTPRPVKVIGLVSLLSWMAVLFWGRMLPFIGDAF